MRVGLVGWRGMVGSVLMTRMVEESDFGHFEARFFDLKRRRNATDLACWSAKG